MNELELINTAADESLPISQRRDALRHLGKLRNESTEIVNTIPADDLRFVAKGVQAFPLWKPLTIADAAEAIAEGRARRSSEQRRR